MDEIIKIIENALTFKETKAIIGNNIYFDTPCISSNNNLHWCLEMENNSDIKKFELTHLIDIFNKIEQLDIEGRKLLKQEFPTADEDEPLLDDIIVYTNGSFSIGYNVGETVAGIWYLYAKFSSSFERDNKLIHEFY